MTIMKKTRRLGLGLVLGLSLGSMGTAAPAADYEIDAAHSFIEFRIKHLGYSWLYGRFNRFSGEFSHDPADPSANRISVSIDPASVDTNHAERDKHLRNPDFLDVERYPDAGFESTGYTGDAESGILEGMLTLHGGDEADLDRFSQDRRGQGPLGRLPGRLHRHRHPDPQGLRDQLRPRPGQRDDGAGGSASRAFGSRPTRPSRPAPAAVRALVVQPPADDPPVVLPPPPLRPGEAQSGARAVRRGRSVPAAPLKCADR